jgi:hypothetical protein
MGKSNWKDMREFLSVLEGQGEAIHVKEEVDPEWEINGITRVALQRLGPAVVFDKIKGADYPLVTGLLATDKRFLLALDIEELSEFNGEWTRRTEQLIPPKIVGTGVCQILIEYAMLNGTSMMLRPIRGLCLFQSPKTQIQDCRMLAYTGCQLLARINLPGLRLSIRMGARIISSMKGRVSPCLWL